MQRRDPADPLESRLGLEVLRDELLTQNFDRGDALGWRATQPVAQVRRRRFQLGAENYFVHALTFVHTRG